MSHDREADLAVLECHRADEYKARLAALANAAAGEVPAGQNLQSWVAAGLVDLMQRVDLQQVSAAVAAVQESGYVIVPGVLDDATVERVRDGMEPLFAGCRRMFEQADPASSNRSTKDRSTRHRSSGAKLSSWSGQRTNHVQNVLAKTEAADEVACNPLLRAIIAGVLGGDFILNAGVVAMSPDPGCVPQGLHRDDGFFTLLPRPHMPLVVTAAIALDDFTRENGGTQIVPGSSCWEPAREAEPHEVIHCEMTRGSMLLWDGAVLHGGGGNSTSGQSRRTVTLNYTRGWLRTQFNQYLSVPRARVLAMPATLQADLGYHHSASGLGGCDTQDPLKYLARLDKAGGDGSQRELGRELKLRVK